jgi:cytochrome c oxidase assembly protein subunit 11
MSAGRGSNVVWGLGVALVICGMVGASFAAVPLYRIFCAVTGYAGTPNITAAAAPGATRHLITVRFNAETNSNLPWRFVPVQPEITLPIGEEQIAFYRARNLATEPVTGIAVYNVTPDKIGKYFHKTACFCFNQQTLSPGQDMQFPLSFWVDPAIATDPNTADVHTITLSYTFSRTLEDAAKAGLLAKAGPHVGPLHQTQAAR